MFEARLEKASVFKKAIEAMKESINEAAFDCDDTGVCAQAMNTSHTMLISLKLLPALFETFRCDRTVSLGLNLTNLGKALKFANNDDICTLRFDDHAQDGVTFGFEDQENAKTQEVYIKLMDLCIENLNIPDQKYAAYIVMDSAEFIRILRNIAQFTDTVCIDVVEDGVTFSGGGDIGKSSAKYDVNNNSEKPLLSFTFEEPVSSSFSLKLMLEFSKSIALAEHVSLSLTNGIPMAVEFKFKGGHLRYYLAAKLDVDE